MSTSRIFSLSVISLSILSAFVTPVQAGELTPQEGLHAAQTYFPSAGTLDAERSNSAAVIDPIRADYAYKLAITGKGVIVATMDTGIAVGHNEFSEAGKVLQGFNAIDSTTNVVDKFGHGTHVAGLIAAGRNGKGIFGVAYDAQLLPIKVLGDDGSGSTAYLDRGLRYAIGKAAIINMSLGAARNYGPSAVQEAVSSGLLLVAAAGNEGAANPNWPARFAKEAWANNRIIAVGAVDASKRIASFSNRAGDTAAWFLVAPGVDIVSSYPADQYAYMSGTSMATPVVSGIAALIKQRWPNLRADQIANILFLTATDLGDPGIDAIYGRGLVNAEKAMQPIGPVTTTTFNGRTITVLAGTTKLSPATSKLWQLAAAGQLQVVGVDGFQRDFHVDLGNTIARSTGMSVDQVFGSMDRKVEVVESVLANGAALAVAFERPVTVAGSRDDPPTRSRLAAFSLMSTTSSGFEAGIGTGGLAEHFFGVGGLELSQDMSLGTVGVLANPYFALVPGASHGTVGARLAGLRLRFGFLGTAANRVIGSQDVWLPTSTLPAPHASAGLFEISTSFGDAALSLSMTQTRETNAYLGSQSTGALSLGNAASTRSLQFSAALLLAPKLALAGQAAYGITPGNGGGNLVTEVTQARTNAFSFGVIASDNLKQGDRLSLTLSQPMRTVAGQMTVDMQTGVAADGTPMRQRMGFSMVPLGRELRGEFSYHRPAGQDASLAFTLMLRHEPDHLVDTPMDRLIACRYVKSF